MLFVDGTRSASSRAGRAPSRVIPAGPLSVLVGALMERSSTDSGGSGSRRAMASVSSARRVFSGIRAISPGGAQLHKQLAKVDCVNRVCLMRIPRSRPPMQRWMQGKQGFWDHRRDIWSRRPVAGTWLRARAKT